MFLLFFCGFFIGILFILFLIFGIFFFNILDRNQGLSSLNNNGFNVHTTNKARIPQEIKAFLTSSSDGIGSEWESCSSFSLLLHFLFQEIKDTRQFRRWLYKKLQLELNDATARSSTAGRIIQDIHIRDLDVGTHAPMIKNVKISEFKLCESDVDMFDELVLLLDLEYKGGFQMSVDALMAFGKFAQLSVKLVELKGRARLTITRQPFAHWNFCFVENPLMNLKIDSQFQGRNLRHLIPLITTAFRKIVQLKHVWPNYKIRFRPFFQNPLFNISPNISALEHIQLDGTGLEVTVLNSSRLNISLRYGGQNLFCKVFLDKRPFGCSSFNKIKGTSHTSNEDLVHLQCIMLSFSRKGLNDKIGLTFGIKNGKDVYVDKLEPNSNAEKCGFKQGDILVAVNNIAVRNERQAIRLLSGTTSDLLILVERKLEEKCLSSTTSSTLSKPSKSVDDFILLGVEQIEEFRAEDVLEDEEEINKDEGKCLFKSASDSIELLVPLQTKSQSFDYLQQQQTNFKTNNNKTLENEKQQHVGENKVAKQVLQKVSDKIVKQVGEKIVKHVVNKNEEKQKEEHVGGEQQKQPTIVKHVSGKIVRNDGSFRRIKKKKNLLRRSKSDSSLTTKHREEIKIEEYLNKKDEAITTNVLLEKENKLNNLDVDETISINSNISSSNSKRSTTDNLIKSKRERLHAKANEMAKHWQAGRTKINELWNRRKPSELAIEVNDEMVIELLNGNNNENNNLETPNEDNKQGKRMSPSPSLGKQHVQQIDGGNINKIEKSNKFLHDVNMQKTKKIALTKDPLWGQSLHFTLTNESFYLNVLICADAVDEKETSELVGFTSIYVPRIIDDCTLTLSNSHRERFHLKGHKERENIISQEFEELSKHNGFDSRLCFGDIILGFRFFPDGLPNNCLNNPKEEVENEIKKDADGEHKKKEQQQVQTQNVGGHKWINLHTKHGLHFSCAICSGKIWLKGGTRCEKCLLICHTNSKCLDKAKLLECKINSNNNDDEPFEELLIDESPIKKEISSGNYSDEQKISDSHQQQQQESDNKCRRRRIAEKLQTTMSTLKQVSGGIRKRRGNNLPEIANLNNNVNNNNIKDEIESPTNSTSRMSTESPESPPSSTSLQHNINNNNDDTHKFIAISDVLDKQFFDSLDGFPKELNINELKFEPGNAYNPQVICETKLKGKLVFENLSSTERKIKINKHIDRVQTMIEKVTKERRSLPCTDEDFDIIDNRLQALALVMLLYCSGLSDCLDKEEAETDPETSNKTEEID